MIKLIKPYICFEEIENEFKDIFSSGCFTKGKNVDLFIDEIKAYTNTNHALLTTSATTALSVCLKILGVTTGDEVIVSDFSFPASANVIEDLGAKPVFSDVDLETFNMLPEELEKKITPKTKAVIFVDAFGSPTGIHEIKGLCTKNNIPLIDDAACAIGSSENNIKSGNIADLSCFSFHPRKLITTGEGGAITTNNEKYHEKLQVKLNHGVAIKEGKFDFVDYGYNYRLAELQCVMGIKQIRKLEKIISGRAMIRDQYIERLTNYGFIPQKIGNSVIHNVQSLVFKVPDRVERDGLILHLKKEDIEATIGTYCLSGTSYYRSKYNSVQKNAEVIENTAITFPCYDGIDVNYICKIIKKYLC